MRQCLTDAETYLWYHIRRGQVGHRFRRQAPTGPYIPDFLCIRCGLVVEADGTQHFENPYDAARDRWFADHGYTVLRFWNHEILEQIDMVLDTIAGHPCVTRNRGREPRTRGNHERQGRLSPSRRDGAAEATLLSQRRTRHVPTTPCGK